MMFRFNNNNNNSNTWLLEAALLLSVQVSGKCTGWAKLYRTTLCIWLKLWVVLTSFHLATALCDAQSCYGISICQTRALRQNEIIVCKYISNIW